VVETDPRRRRMIPAAVATGAADPGGGSDRGGRGSSILAAGATGAGAGRRFLGAGSDDSGEISRRRRRSRGEAGLQQDPIEDRIRDEAGGGRPDTQRQGRGRTVGHAGEERGAAGEAGARRRRGRGGRRRPDAAAGGRGGRRRWLREERSKTYCSDTMLGIDKLYSLGAKGHNI
jgi:hypothetical protein